MQNAAIQISTWFHDAEEEAGMIEDHAYLWHHMLDAIPQRDFSKSRVLDYGCNQGGFLHALHARAPYASGVGVDVAVESLAAARQRCAHLPVAFCTPEDMRPLKGDIDIAFSHEVLYLLPDLSAHAAAMASVLKPRGVYYAAIGCHTGNPLWSDWRTRIAGATSLPVCDYSLDDYAQALWKAGFTVMMRPFAYDDFVLIKPNNAYFPQAADSLNYHTQVKILICARKAG